MLLHGTPLRPAIWGPTARGLTDQPVVVPDLTTVPVGPTPQAATARKLVETLPAGAWDVVGHSFGGQVAIELALASPERVRSLTILCSRDTPFPSFAAMAERLRAARGPTVAQGLGRWFLPVEIEADGIAVRSARDDLTAALDRPQDWAAALEAIAVFDRAEDAERLPPTTFLAMTQDAVSTPDVMRDMAARVPGAVLRRRDGAHMSPFVAPLRLAADLRRWRDRSRRLAAGDPGVSRGLRGAGPGRP